MWPMGLLFFFFFLEGGDRVGKGGVGEGRRRRGAIKGSLKQRQASFEPFPRRKEANEDKILNILG